MNVIASIWKLRCPRCRSGGLFTEPFSLSDPLSMPKYCSTCGLKTNPEPGFYFGAMFLSYIISGFAFLAIALLGVFYFKWSVVGAMTAVVIVGLLTYLRLLRVSRALWIHLTVSYEPDRPRYHQEGESQGV